MIITPFLPSVSTKYPLAQNGDFSVFYVSGAIDYHVLLHYILSGLPFGLKLITEEGAWQQNGHALAEHLALALHCPSYCREYKLFYQALSRHYFQYLITIFRRPNSMICATPIPYDDRGINPCDFLFTCGE